MYARTSHNAPRLNPLALGFLRFASIDNSKAALETFMGVDQRTGEVSKPHIRRVVSKSDSILWTATMATEPLG